jgi:hypothetical protein
MAGNLESQVSVPCLNPTGVAASISGGILRCDRASGDPVEKQVFADCTDRGTTAAVGGKGSFAPVPVNGGNAPIPAVRGIAIESREATQLRHWPREFEASAT